MATHLTLRMAWHDSGWNGKICARPQDNPYCVGSHSLLSERMARDKNLEVETVQAGQSLDSLMPDYLPPCYWSTNAMSAEQASVVHVHPFPDLKDKRIDDELPPYAAFTWPFRLSFNHRKETKKRDGLYPRDLEKNVSGFFEKLKPKPPTSFVFFYLNYDNPVSADEYKYALVGCAKVTGVGDPTQFSFSEAELSAKRNSPKTKYFPTMNWAIRISSSFAESGIRLPYHEYLAHMQTHPEDEPKLEEMRVLIDEPPLVRRFKYVAEEVDDDRCLYLLYKLRKAIKIVQEQGIVSMDREESLIEHYIGEVWQRRGLYPGLDSVLRLLVGLSAQGEDPAPIAAIQDFLEAVQASLPDAKELLTEVFALLTGERNLPEELAPYRPLIRKAKRGLSDHIGLLDVLKKLTLFALTEFQLKRILFPDATDKGMHPFRGQSVRTANIAKNPYLLCEKYVPVGSDQASRDTELEQPHIRDGSIGLFDIDIGMFPDERFIERDDELQDLTPASPERLRALVVEYLRVRSSAGDCYASLPDVHKFLVGQALFYARDLLIAF